jgi:hypothetical protein
MDELIKLLDKRDIRQISKNLYIKNLNRISQGLQKTDYLGNEFLKDSKKVLEFVGTFTQAIQKNMVSSILVAISYERRAFEGFEDAYQIYNMYLKELYSANAIPEGDKTLKECNNWLNWEDILKIVDVKGKIIKKMGINSSSDKQITKNDFNMIQEYIVMCLYTMLPPKRLEYGDCRIIDEKDYKALGETDKKDNAYLVIKSRTVKYFSFGVNTLKSSIGVDKYQIIDIPKNLNSVLNIWMNFNKTKYLLVNEKAGLLGRNNLTKLLNKIFTPYHKNISASMLRKAYISFQDQADFEKNARKIERARLMGHSVTTAAKNYLKRN